MSVIGFDENQYLPSASLPSRDSPVFFTGVFRGFSVVSIELSSFSSLLLPFPNEHSWMVLTALSLARSERTREPALVCVEVLRIFNVGDDES